MPDAWDQVTECPARHRWVVERSHAWFSRARRLPDRYERRADIYGAFTVLRASLITVRQITRVC